MREQPRNVYRTGQLRTNIAYASGSPGDHSEAEILPAERLIQNDERKPHLHAGPTLHDNATMHSNRLLVSRLERTSLVPFSPVLRNTMPPKPFDMDW